MSLSLPRSFTPAPVRAAAREVLHHDVVRDSVRFARLRGTVAPALRVGLASGLAIALPALVGHREASAFAALGALTSLYCRDDPYRRRATLLTAVAGVLVGSIAVFSLITALGVPDAAAFALMAALAAAATALVMVLRMGAPGATILIFCAGGGMAVAPGLSDVLPRTLAGASGALLAWVVCMAGAVVRPTAPARLAVRRAADAVRVALRAGDAHTRAVAANLLDGARRTLADDATWARARPDALVLAENVRLLQGALDEAAGVERPSVDAPLPDRLSLLDQLRSGASRPGWRLAAARVLIGGLTASAVASGLGVGHTAWAVMGSTAVLQGASARHAAVRAVQRAAGTAAGALLLAYPLLSAHPGFWPTAAIVVVLTVATEVVVGRNYGVAQMTIAPMALLMTTLGQAADPATLARDRALDTALGAAAGLLTVLLVHRYGRRRA
ncbi:FUSC family protein [Xylanimonas ulmi]|uniref:Fusaric acid resistance family protein n=1 Tax=Xylanimonas ulmi TaxID=228973 RepID=A0A4Q7LZR3_9MICO|nr:FUSC family protein [Xylanibacterium ulmi]RZS60311.1 fusaric acid resistance family protein [Xylanibacterium ulmi]